MYASSTSSRNLAALCGAIIIAGIAMLYTWNWYNTSISLENATTARWRQSQNSYSNFTNKVVEVAGVAVEYQQQFRSILRATMEGRYGDGGGRALVFVQEHNPTLDASTYHALQTVIEAGRNEFAREQQSLLEHQRAYQNHLEALGGGMLAKICGFPRIKRGEDAPVSDRDGDGRMTVLDYPIIQNAASKKAFQTGSDEPLKPFAL